MVGPTAGYRRHTQREGYGQGALTAALDAVANGASMRQAAKQFGISRTTLRRHHHDTAVRQPGTLSLGRWRTILPEMFEEQLLQHILDMQARFFGLTGDDVRQLAFQLATANGIAHPFDNDTLHVSVWGGGAERTLWRFAQAGHSPYRPVL